ncbi:MAG: 5-deoxy-glucuronate isomerase, partial [Spirochaetaceae bacterium]|nr:5-deoxy-glucuronate isomerase [Spirochaetaceae bacterium]
MQFHHKPPFNRGWTMLSPRSGQGADMLMDFGVLEMLEGDQFGDNSATDERIWLLARGNALITWAGGEQKVSRGDLFDYSPWCLSVPARCAVSITALPGGAEWYYVATDNPRAFAPRLYTPQECRSEMRGEGTM